MNTLYTGVPISFNSADTSLETRGKEYDGMIFTGLMKSSFSCMGMNRLVQALYLGM